jgi:hypothetical protein
LTETGRPAASQIAALLLVLSLALTFGPACSTGNPAPNKRIEPVYDKKTGRLQLLNYDSDGDGKIDIWSHMDGARVVLIEIDTNADGKIDRWEYYGADQKLEKVGSSRADDGKEDAWSYAAPDGSIARIEVSTKRDGKVDRVEHYERNALVGAEEDTDGDGKPDKWETYDAGGRLASVAFDTQHRGTPNRRLFYSADGSVRVESDETDAPAPSAKAVRAR